MGKSLDFQKTFEINILKGERAVYLVFPKDSKNR